jgi:hypothetical protein
MICWIVVHWGWKSDSTIDFPNEYTNQILTMRKDVIAASFILIKKGERIVTVSKKGSATFRHEKQSVKQSENFRSWLMNSANNRFSSRC